MPDWYDLLLFGWFAWVGFLLGMASLVPVQAAVSRKWGSAAGWVVVVVVIVLGSVGVYVGRFLHWNSWDVIRSPGIAIDRISVGIGHPLRLFGFTALLSSLFLVVYVAIRAFSGLLRDSRGRSS